MGGSQATPNEAIATVPASKAEVKDQGKAKIREKYPNDLKSELASRKM